MTTTVPTQSEQVLQVGPDRVTVTDRELIIEARHAMPDWEVREMNPIPVYFGESKYCLLQKRKAQPPYAVRYVLRPWPEGQTISAKSFHTYDAEAVAEREDCLQNERFDEVLRALLLPFYPLLGFLWSGTQRRLMRFGFVPHSITGASIFTAFALLFAQGVFAMILMNSRYGIGGLIRAMAREDSLHLGPIAIPFSLLDLLLSAALLIDLPARYRRYCHEDQWAGGVLEWLVRRDPKS
jgi:hypothetical protein